MTIRHDWDLEEIRAIHNMPLLPLVLRASEMLRTHHVDGEVQCCEVLNVKVGGCEEDCAYCGQSSHYKTHAKPKPMLKVEEVVEKAKVAKSNGVTRVCISAAWREVRDGKAFDNILEMVRQVKALGIEVCCTLGLLAQEHVNRLKDAGVHSINHNLDTSEEHYPNIITTRTYADRLDTIARVRHAGLFVCSGVIIGMGETLEDRFSMLRTLSSLNPHPDSVPINLLVPIAGTPLENCPQPTAWELLRMVATARILMPKAMVRLSAGRLKLSLSQQAICFLAGANSVHMGSQLLVTRNLEHHVDHEMFRTLGLTPQPPYQKEVGTPKPAADPIDTHMQKALDSRREQGNLRSLRVVEDLVDLTSNDYLGFARSQQLLDRVNAEFHALIEEGGIRPYVGATGSRLLTGNTAYVEALENSIASFHGAEAALLFNSGYVANVGLLSSVISKEDTIILDTQAHASTWEGAKLSGAKQLLFKHNDVDHLVTQLKKANGRVFVCVESLYSMSGDIAPLTALCDACDAAGANLIVDEAHATGLFGREGRGIVSAYGLEDRVFARLHTFGKALGTHGAVIVGSSLLREYLLNFARPFIYTTATPLHTLVSIRCAYDHMRKAEPERQKLQALILAFKAKVAAKNLRITPTPTPIQMIGVSTADQAKALSANLAAAGLDVRAILSPTVRRGSEGLRVCLHAFNEPEQLDRLFEVLTAETESHLTDFYQEQDAMPYAL